MTDNAKAYTAHRFQDVLRASSAPSHIPPRPTRRAGTAKPNASSEPSRRMGPHPHLAHQPRRDRALSSFLRYYNRRRPHTSLGDRPPISRVHQDRGQDS